MNQSHGRAYNLLGVGARLSVEVVLESRKEREEVLSFREIERRGEGRRVGGRESDVGDASWIAERNEDSDEDDCKDPTIQHFRLRERDLLELELQTEIISAPSLCRVYDEHYRKFVKPTNGGKLAPQRLILFSSSTLPFYRARFKIITIFKKKKKKFI